VTSNYPAKFSSFVTLIFQRHYAPLILAPAEGFSLDPSVWGQIWGRKILMGTEIVDI
jgi:hypothetical protein